jgi:aldehyde dehydrogenase (NAD+)
MHVANGNMPFGGVMSSGNGSYHGINSFNTFSHHKSIVNMSTKLDIWLKYPPYTNFKFWLLKKIA